MTYLSRDGQRIKPVLELDGIRYQQTVDSCGPELARPCGYLEATDTQTGQRLWVKQIYNYDDDTDPEFAVTSHDPDFLRIKHRPGTRDILIENTCRGKYFINIDTQEVREATPADFPPPVKRAPPPEVPPIEYKGMRYEQIMDGRDYLKPDRCGYMMAVDIKTNSRYRSYRMYDVPFNDEIEDDQQECYFRRMVLLPGEQDILVENEAGDKYLCNIKREDVRPLTIPESDYQPEIISRGTRIKDAIKAFFGIKTRAKDKFSI